MWHHRLLASVPCAICRENAASTLALEFGPGNVDQHTAHFLGQGLSKQMQFFTGRGVVVGRGCWWGLGLLTPICTRISPHAVPP